MTELWLKFTDETGESKRILVKQKKFAVGRHSDNNISVADSRLSREHIKIERFADIFIVSECGSSNGTTLNGSSLIEPLELKNGDKLNLGGGLEIETEITSDDPNAGNSSVNASGEISTESGAENPAQKSTNLNAQGVSASSGESSIPSAVLWLAPVFGVLILIITGGLFFAFSGKNEKETAENDRFTYTEKEVSTKKDVLETDETPTPKTSRTAENFSVNTSTVTTPETEENTPLPPKASGETGKVEQNAASFLRRIAINDPKAFLTGKQLEIVNSKIGQLKNSGALAANLKAVKKMRRSLNLWRVQKT